MKKKQWLNLTAAIIILAFSIWLSLNVRTWDSVKQLLQGAAVALIIMLFLREETKAANLAVFFVRSFFISYVLTGIIWFVSLGVAASPYFAYLGSWLFIYSLIYVILPSSLLPVAISVIVYGIVKMKLKPWEILLSTWYVSIFAVFAAYDIWWSLFVQPYLTHFYSSGAGPIALGMLLVFLAFFIACIFSVFYLVVKKSEEKLPFWS